VSSRPSRVEKRTAIGDPKRYLSIPYNIRLQVGGNEVSRQSMKATFLICGISAAVLLSSCNTIIGIGRDMRIGGEGLENAANKVTGGGSSGGDTSGAPVY
jgi:predicted small secreted protein